MLYDILGYAAAAATSAAAVMLLKSRDDQDERSPLSDEKIRKALENEVALCATGRETFSGVFLIESDLLHRRTSMKAARMLLDRHLRKEDIAGVLRDGGILVIARDLGDNDKNALINLKKIAAKLQTKVALFDKALSDVRVSGIALPIDANSASEALAKLDELSDECAQAPGCKSITMQENLIHKHEMEIVNAVIEAIDAGLFQPRYVLQKNLGNGQIVGCESFARIVGDGLTIYPGEFMPAVEEMGKTEIVDLNIISQTAQLAMKVLKEVPHFLFEVNISLSTLKKPGMHHKLAQIVSPVIEAGGVFVLDVPFEALEDAQALQNMEVLKDAGVQFAIENFAESGRIFDMEAWRHLIDHLNISRSVTESLSTGHAPEVVIKGVDQMAKDLGMSMHFEGVESQAQIKRLKNIVANEKARYQGYLISRPINDDELLRRIKSGGV